MSQFDQVRGVLKQLERVADHLTKQGDSEALRDFRLQLTQTLNYFADYAEQQQEALLSTITDEQSINNKGDNEELSFDLDQVDTPIQSHLPKAKKEEELLQQPGSKTDQLPAQLKQFKDIELYIGDKFTQYGCTFEQDLFTPNDPLKIGIIHAHALLLIFRKLGVYLSPTETTLLLTKFKPTQAQIDDYIRTHTVQQHNLPISTHFVNYSLFFLYLQALNNVALTSRAVIKSNVPALMAGRALQYQPSNPHPLDLIKDNAKIQGLVAEKDITRQTAAFNEPMAQVTLVSEHANKPKDYVVNLVEIHKLIQEFASGHPSPSRIYSSIKRSTAHTENVTRYGENTMTIDALLVGLKTFNFKLSSLPCSVDIFKQYIGLYSEAGIPAIRFPEFVSFLNCEEPKKGWSGLLADSAPPPTQTNGSAPFLVGNTTYKNQLMEKPLLSPEPPQFIELISATIKDRGFSQAMVTFSAAEPRQLFRQLSRGGITITGQIIITHLIDSRCPENLVNNDYFKRFIRLYSTSRDEYLNYNDFAIFKDCKLNYEKILKGEFTKPTIIPDDTPLYSSFLSISNHFNVVNPHLSFHYCVQSACPKPENTTTSTALQYLSQVQFYNALYAAQINISYDQTLFLFDALNARTAQSPQADDGIAFLHPTDPARATEEGEKGTLFVPLVYLPFTVLNAIIVNPLVYPLIQTAYTNETGQQYTAKGPTVQRTTNSNAASLNNEMDLVTLMDQLCLSTEDQPSKPKPPQRFQSSLIQDMTDDSYSSSSDLQHGARKHFKDHVQNRRQLRTSIGFGNPTKAGASRSDGAITTEDAELIHSQRIANQQDRLNINFETNHGGRTPIRSRVNNYPHGQQSYSLTTAAMEDHPVQFGSKTTHHTTTTFDEMDTYQTTLAHRGQNSRSFTSSVLKLRNTPMQSRATRKPLAPQSSVMMGVHQDAMFTPQKDRAISGQRYRVYPNRNQTAVEMQLETLGDEHKTRYQRATYDPEVSRQMMGHLNDGFQPADTPFLMRRLGKFAKLTQKDQVIADDLEYQHAYEQAAERINPRDKERRRTGYHNPNNVSDLMNLEKSHPVFQSDTKLILDIDNALLNQTELDQYIIDNTNRSYKDLASRQLISVQQQQNDNISLDSLPQRSTPPKQQQHQQQQPRDASLEDEFGIIFALDQEQISIVDDGPQNDKQPAVAIQDEPKPPQLPPGQLSPEQLQELNNQFTSLSCRIGKSREVYGKWSEYGPALTAVLLHKALVKNDFQCTLQNVQQLIDSVNQEPGGNLNLSGFSRLLGRGTQ